MSRTTLSLDHLARVEGHGDVHLVIEDGLVKTVEMRVTEPARLFESMVRGRSFRETSYICSRVCGICSESHVITDLKAIEFIFGIKVTPRTEKLRELLVYGSYLQNHCSHLYVFAVPDYLGQRSVFPLAQNDPALLDKALKLKALGNELCTKVGGRSIHPITAVVGGFTHEIDAREYERLADELEAMVPFAIETVDLFASFPIPVLETRGDMLALVEESAYPVQSSTTLAFASGARFEAADKDDHLEEYGVDHSAAFFSREKRTGQSYMTGALARINLSWNHLSSEAKIAAAKVGLRPPERNPFKNNLAQAVEIVDALVRCARLCRELAEGEGDSAPLPYKPCAGRGVGVTEAPRGIVFHSMELDDEGRVQHANIVPPTCQNLANLEGDIVALAELLTSQGAISSEIVAAVEKLVRAYDPCFSCSVH